MRYLDSDTLEQCHLVLRDGRSLDDLAGKLHFESEHLGRLLQLPVSQPATVSDTSPDLWAADRLDGVL